MNDFKRGIILCQIDQCWSHELPFVAVVAHRDRASGQTSMWVCVIVSHKLSRLYSSTCNNFSFMCMYSTYHAAVTCSSTPVLWSIVHMELPQKKHKIRFILQALKPLRCNKKYQIFCSQAVHYEANNPGVFSTWKPYLRYCGIKSVVMVFWRFNNNWFYISHDIKNMLLHNIWWHLEEFA